MAKLNSLKGAAVVFFTDRDTGARYRAFVDGTYVFIGSPELEARMRGVLDAMDVPYADEPAPLDRDIYGVEIVAPGKLVRQYLQAALRGDKLPGE